MIVSLSTTKWFHFIDKYLCVLIISTSSEISRGFLSSSRLNFRMIRCAAKNVSKDMRCTARRYFVFTLL